MCGVLEDLVSLLGDFSPRLVTYAGGASSLKDLDRVGYTDGAVSAVDRCPCCGFCDVTLAYHLRQ